ncbi:MAG TPA: NUDIX hydrolase [Terracidiphilus sp.]|jgi:8-oxo-dGTP pyrophosphatase MutT (NUDIX family)|nr:NUDIX hydrolase [Terracidiphilus sp.]
MDHWRVQESELVLNNRWAKVRRDSCELANGVLIPDYYYWEGGDFAVVFALTVNGEVLLTRQYKHGVREITLELPAGLIDAEDESPLMAAHRELREETGYAAGEWSSLGTLNVSSAKATTRAYIFLACEVTAAGAQSLDQNEEIECLEVSLEEFRRLVLCGSIHDASSIAAGFLALNLLQGGDTDSASDLGNL